MMSHPKKALQDSSSAMLASTSQMQQGAGADSLCPICPDNVDNTAYVNTCLHAFCFRCIQQHAARRALCPLCRRPFDRILHTVKAENDYRECVVSSFARQQKTTARQRLRSRSPQQRYNLCSRPISDEPAKHRREPAGRGQVARVDAAPRNSDARHINDKPAT